MKKIRNIHILIGFFSTLLFVSKLSIEGVSISVVFIGSVVMLALIIAYMSHKIIKNDKN